MYLTQLLALKTLCYLIISTKFQETRNTLFHCLFLFQLYIMYLFYTYFKFIHYEALVFLCLFILCAISLCQCENLPQYNFRQSSIYVTPVLRIFSVPSTIFLSVVKHILSPVNLHIGELKQKHFERISKNTQNECDIYRVLPIIARKVPHTVYIRDAK